MELRLRYRLLRLVGLAMSWLQKKSGINPVFLQEDKGLALLLTLASCCFMVSVLLVFAKDALLL